LEGEIVPLERSVVLSEQVERFLGQLADEMQSTLRKLLEECISTLDIAKFPSQILCLSEAIHFTQRCEVAIQSAALNALETELKQLLDKYTSFDPGDDVVLDLKLKSLVMDLIHNIDVVVQLRKAQCTSLNDWAWQKQLRYYYTQDKNVIVRMCEAQLSYTWEYQGNSPKLVHTPLTDKCYLTLTQGMHLGYGGNPYGPAGTGKTESVKALAQALGRQCLVFNCDEGIDWRSMGRIFTGLVKCGAWGCFDEFNRLDEEVLSAVSQQIQVIQAALKARLPELELLDKKLIVNPNAGIFVTLNPAGKGYLGRSKLPDNLKQLFRAVAMSLPDNDLIAEVILYSEGFQQAKILAHKLVSIFTLARQLLSAQQHYDWGLRALKTVLRVGGQLIQAEKRAGRKVTLEVEVELIIKSLRVNTLSKLTFADGQRFNGLIADVYPGAKATDISYEDLEKAIREVLGELKLQYFEGQVRKMLQFYEATKQRIGVVIVGPSGCGKSTLWRVLQLALEKLGQRIVRHTFNPKAMERTQLLGKMDHDTREWYDGVLTKAARQVIIEPPGVQSWVLADGDIDPEWIESLNSVLDDNHLLTMPSGERIQFGPNVNFIFETHDLRFASPATVSRMGMIFLSDENMDVKLLVQSWLSLQPPDIQQKLQGWMENIFFRALEWVLSCKAIVVETTRNGLVMNALSHLKGIDSKSAFVVGLIRGFGANMDTEARSNFAREVFGWANERPIDARKPLDCYYDPQLGALKAYTLDTSTAQLDAEEIKQLMGLPPVLTVDVQKNMDLVTKWVQDMEPFLLVGPEGSGKNLMMNYIFSSVKSCQVATIHCSAQTTAVHVMQKLNQMCGVFSSTSGRVYRPRDADRLILYLKDVNLPKPDKYDTMQLIAFLHQLVTYKGFYDKNLEWLGLERIQIVASMNPATTVGRHPLNTRFTSIVRVAYMSYPDREQLQIIYGSALSAALTPQVASHPVWKQPSNIAKLAGTMIDFYDQVRASFSVDDRRHYLFTPRDLTSWVLGLMRYDLSSIDLLEAWRHEASRIFRDRLVGTDSQTRFDGLANGVLRKDWKVVPDLRDIYFTAVGSVPSPGQSMRMLNRMARKDFELVVQQGLMTYERVAKELNMFLFSEILDHIVRFDRVLSQPGGSMLLAGRNGVGRRTAVTLVSYMLRMNLFSPSMTRDYNTKAFRTDLKTVMLAAGIEGTPTVLFLEDHQFVDETILETLNSLLSGGEVPGLFTNEELEPHLGPLRDLMSREGFRYKTLFQFFVSRVQQNLHIVASMDPTNSNFLLRCESNPALYTRCSIQWLDAWSEQSLDDVARMSLKDVLEGFNEKERERTVGYMKHIHQSCVSRTNATPRNFIAFIETYREIYKSKREAHEQQQQHLQSGLSKLSEAAGKVDELSRQAEQSKIQLAEKQKQADEALKKITESMKIASERRTEVETLQGKLSVEEKKLKTRRSQVDQELSEIQPILDQAKTAVGQIRNDNLQEMRSYKMPPEPVRDVLEGVLRLMSIYDTSWISMKRFLGNRTVKDEILNYDARAITPQVRKDVSDLVKSRAASFEPANIQRVSVAASPMAAWVVANIRYSEVLEKISPLENELAVLSKSQEAARDRIKKCEEAVLKLDEQVGALKDEFQKRTSEATELRLSLEKATSTLQAAQSLLGKLGGEKSRWDEQTRELTLLLSNLATHALLAGAFVTYLPSEPEVVRSAAIQEWTNHMGVSAFNFTSFMSTESQLLVWKREGMPADDLSMDNGLAIECSHQVPFIIDPSTQATEWIKTHLKDRQIEVVVSGEARFSTTVEMAVRFGKTLLITEVDRIEPFLYPLLRRDLMRDGPRATVTVGDKAVDFNDRFKLYLATRNPHPDLPPDALALINPVNFIVTRSGLEGQLLGLTLQYEQPELEEQKSALLRSEEEAKVQMAVLEKQLLMQLASSQGNILENTPLIQSLEETKVNAIAILKSLEESRVLQAALDKQRNSYRPIAYIGSVIFFLIRDLSRLNHMYRFSLAVFLRLFTKALHILKTQCTEKAVEARIKVLNDSLIKLVVGYVTRSLFKADRLTFAMHLVHGLYPQKFAPQEWELFTGVLVADISDNVSKSFPPWATRDRAQAYNLLETTFPNIVRALNLGDVDSWSRWARSPQCEIEFPPKYIKSVTPFERLLVVQALRPDRLESAMGVFACELLGMSSVGAGVVNLSGVYMDESTAGEAILLITTPGADPSQELEEIADRTVGAAKYRQLAMGQGQAEIALQMLKEAAEVGDWVCLKNLHLVTTWLPTLEKTLKTIHLHDNFRLWLTSEPHPKFATILLEQSLKITFEAPPGVKRNLQRSYESVSSMSTEVPQQLAASPVRAQLLFVLAWFHAVVQERRTYIPQGWTKFYEFSFADLRSSADIIDIVMGKMSGSKMEWPTIHGLLENAIYGGRVDNIYDVRVLRTYLLKYFSPDILNGRQTGQRLYGNFVLPGTANPADFMKIIQALPDTDSPALFGLPPNIERVVQRVNSSSVISQLKALAIASVGMAKFDRSVWAAQLSPLIQLWAKMTSSNDAIKEQPPPPSGALAPVETFVLMEQIFANQLVALVDNSLQAISRVIRGAGLLTPSIQSDASYLLAAKVPPQWSSKWDGPSDSQAYLRGLVGRAAAVAEWKQNVERGSFSKQKLDLSELFHPDTFLNALCQQTARALKRPMDELRLVASWDATDLKKRSPMAVDIAGLLAQGGGVDNGRLVDVTADAPAVQPVPPCTIAWLAPEESDPYPEQSSVGIPVYFSTDRERLLSEFKLICNDKASWILTGCAMFLSESE